MYMDYFLVVLFHLDLNCGSCCTLRVELELYRHFLFAFNREWLKSIHQYVENSDFLIIGHLKCKNTVLNSEISAVIIGTVNGFVFLYSIAD
jgi:hypothetical protein